MNEKKTQLKFVVTTTEVIIYLPLSLNHLIYSDTDH